MAFRRALARCFTNSANPSSSSLPSLIPPPRCSSSPSSSIATVAPSTTSLSPKTLFLNHRPVLIHRDELPPEGVPFPVGGGLVDRIRGMSPGRIHLEGLSPRLPPPPAAKEVEDRVPAAQARKVLRAAQMQAVRARLRGVGRSCVSYEEFSRICGKVKGVESGATLARALDESGAVVVFLRPEMVAKAIENMIPTSLPQAEREELKEMEEKKASIDAKAESLVRREMWCGLAFLALQTAGFMRLTFWELSWDVMEPICFYVTSAYFMFGYAFFLRTSKDPSFEGFFESRFAAKQRRLFKTQSFDSERFNELRKSVLSSLQDSSSSSSSSLQPSAHRSRT